MIYYEVKTKEGITIASEENYQAALKIANSINGTTVTRVRNEYGSFENV